MGQRDHRGIEQAPFTFTRPTTLRLFTDKTQLGGHDYQYVLPELAAKLDTRYLLKTSDTTPAYIQIKTDGWRTGPLDVLQALNDPVTADDVDPSLYKFRLFIGMNTGDVRYNHVNTTMWVASGMRKGAKVIYDAYRVG